MKILIVILFLLCSLIVWGIASVVQPIFRVKAKKVDIPVSKERLYQDVSYLTELQPARNYQNLGSLNAAADYIKNEFEQLKARVETQSYEVEGATYHNIIASFGDNNAPRIIIGAHYDVCGNQPGADDNASAVAGLLELARLVDSLKPNLKYRLDFVAYSLEEPPFFRTPYMGSAVHAKSLYDAKVEVELMICLEMIGYFSDQKGSQHYPISLLKLFYPNRGNFIAVIGKRDQGKSIKSVKRKMKEVANIDVRSISAPERLPGIDFSDHQNYWKYGYDAVMVNNSAFYRNPNYHQPSDTIETLNFDKMAEVVRGVYWSLVN